MALLNDTASRRRSSKTKSAAPVSSPEPQSLPDSDTLKRIESLERELAEAKASGEASKAEVADLTRRLNEALAAAASQKTIVTTKTDDRPERKSFFGL